MTAPSNRCGSCTACCRVYAIPELHKPAGTWCQHCDIGKSCKVYATRPERCATFECLWLQSQTREVRLAPELRPDKCKVVFAPSTNPRIMTAITMPGAPLAWQGKEVGKLIDRLLRSGVGVAIGPPQGRTQLLLRPNGTRQQVRMTEPDADGMQWSEDAP